MLKISNTLLRSIRITAVLCCCAIVASCSFNKIDAEKPRLAKTILLLSEDFLTAIVKEDRIRIENLVLWTAYLKEKGMSEAQFFAKAKKLNRRFPPGAHPLLELSVIDLDVDEDEASITFERKDWPVPDVFTIDYLWTGTGWVIVDDTLFGEGEHIDFLLSQS